MKALNPVLLLSAATALSASLWATPAAMAAKSFDGAWSVLIVTDAGDCDRAYRYALHIANGRISYDDPSFNVSGHVDPRGHVNVAVSAEASRPLRVKAARPVHHALGGRLLQ